jgi:predicted lipoprotein with Yx(FWY)xxD motif
MRGGLVTIVFAACLVAGCGGGSNSASTPEPEKQPKPAAAPVKKAGKSTFVKARKTRYGRILTDGRGRALYLFTRERTKRAACYGQCANAWPPFYARGTVRAGKGVEQSGVGVTGRRGNRRQVTYNGHPLYYYVTDRAPGEVTCQNVTEFGGTWLVVGPSGKAIL